jgi:hypothetical protein
MNEALKTLTDKRSRSDLERAVLYVSDPQKYDIDYIDVDKAAAELQRLQRIEQERDGLLDNDSQSVDEFNADFDAYKAGMDLDNAEQFYRACMGEVLNKTRRVSAHE